MTKKHIPIVKDKEKDKKKLEAFSMNQTQFDLLLKKASFVEKDKKCLHVKKKVVKKS